MTGYVWPAFTRFLRIRKSVATTTISPIKETIETPGSKPAGVQRAAPRNYSRAAPYLLAASDSQEARTMLPPCCQARRPELRAKRALGKRRVFDGSAVWGIVSSFVAWIANLEAAASCGAGHTR
jgi:hypothetical protein